MDLVIISNRFKSVLSTLEQKGIIKSKAHFADALDTYKQTINDITKGKRNVTLELVHKVCSHYHVNPSFLILGEYPMFIHKDELQISNITYVPIKAQAGYGEQITDPVFENQLTKFFIPGSTYKDEEYRCFEIEGESMSPSYHNGDRVICSSIPQVYMHQALKDRMVYVIVTETSLVLKRIINNINKDKTILLISDNSLYEPKTIQAKEIKEIWRVEGLITNRIFGN
jgi:DNA-binding XRE family transcriptional regulator